jgi:hypothetical protein
MWPGAANPDSIILGSADYQRRESPLNEMLSRSLFVEHTLVFIGCGTGLNDPHIRTLSTAPGHWRCLAMPARPQGWARSMRPPPS